MSAAAKIGLCALTLSLAACSSGSPESSAASSSGPSGGTPAASSAPTASGATTSSSASPAGSTPTASSTPAGIAPVGPGAAIRPGRQLVFATVPSGGRKMLTVGADGVVELTDHRTDRAMFVLTPIKPGSAKYLMQTAKMTEGGEPWCLAVHSPGAGKALQLKIDACDAGKRDQIFTYPETRTGKGRLIEVGGLYVYAEGDDDEVIVQESGEGDAMTAFTVRDEGKSTLPHLGD
ncbi:hypothetical protein ACTOB_007589 [Actinoplanes oblitus]|uniref:Ricin B lectin domain-containing protein n=1 Tax=Actinoplanes oblitus TaxID=3040509 RepID=A0ABY8WEI0_9ACTN|nr:hypothetical protein [Actinoplanes oblitus]WIM95478.1 hypothetical protein ACTOB_007589 [Actinoplanes oblitus]